MSNRSVGTDYERFAADYLKSQGYQIIESNYRRKTGEIDLIAKENDYLCFIEVKYRADFRKGTPMEAVGSRKQKRIKQTARWYLAEHRYFEQAKCRFDVIGICPQKVWLIRNAFGGI